MSKLIRLTDGAGVPFLVNEDHIFMVGAATDEKGNPILGKRVLRTDVINMTPNGPQPVVIMINESIEQVEARLAKANITEDQPALSIRHLK